jgi:hypothetical protein
MRAESAVNCLQCSVEIEEYHFAECFASRAYRAAAATASIGGALEERLHSVASAMKNLEAATARHSQEPWNMVRTGQCGAIRTVMLVAFGRSVAVFVMVAGVGSIASLASILTSIILPSPTQATLAVLALTTDEQRAPAVCFADDGSMQAC